MYKGNEVDLDHEINVYSCLFSPHKTTINLQSLQLQILLYSHCLTTTTSTMYTSTILVTLLAAATAHAAVIDLRAAADFGSCTPTMDFQLGRPGRKATEGTFLPTDPAIAKGQQDALNPNIITNACTTRRQG